MSQSSSSSGANRGNHGWRGQGRGWWRGRGNRGNYRGWRAGGSSNYNRGSYRGWRGSGSTNYNRGASNYATQSSQGSISGNTGLQLMGDPARPSAKSVQTVLHIASPYIGWMIYFPDQVYSDHSSAVDKVQLFEKYFISWNKLYDWDGIEQKGFFIVDYSELSADPLIKNSYSDLSSELLEFPEKVLACMGLAMHQIVSHKHQQEAAAVVDDLGRCTEDITDYCAPYIQARITNFGAPLALKHFKANCYGKFVTVKGTVVRVGIIKPLCTKLAFRCASCSYMQAIQLPDGKFTFPNMCPADKCRGRTFLPCRSDSKTETIDWQTIRVQEIMIDSHKDAGRIPRTIDCELTRDLVDSCVPGDIVTVTGVVKVNSVGEGRIKNKEKCMFLLYLHGNSLVNAKGNNRKSGDDNTSKPGLAMDFTMKELYAIREIQSQENLFQLIVQQLNESSNDLTFAQTWKCMLSRPPAFFQMSLRLTKHGSTSMAQKPNGGLRQWKGPQSPRQKKKTINEAKGMKILEGAGDLSRVASSQHTGRKLPKVGYNCWNHCQHLEGDFFDGENGHQHIRSLCPSIYGHEIVKAGLILGLFGSSQKFTNDKNRIPVRGDPHILVVGDPGLGKSQMLQAAASVSPRSVYVCGNTTTTSGLTVTLSKDSGSGDFALEAGALVLADQGCCCIDEFDKMSSQHQALLEAMEQQSISIAKAGIVCSLPARTSILAAANPVGGHYNKAKTVSENLKLGSPLLSRFDLVFIMLDKPDEEMDCVLSEHVMALHAGTKSSMFSVSAMRESQSSSRLELESTKSLMERLKMSRCEVIDPIPHQLLRKYIGYARKYVHPKIGSEAAAVIQEFYLYLRRRHQSRDSTPITTRQLESLMRLTEARARLELREVASKSDAEDVVEIMKHSMQDVYSDQFGLLDFQRSQHGSGMSRRSQPKRFVSALQKIAEQTYNNIFTVQQMKEISKDIGLQILDMEGFITSLNNHGFLLKKGPKVYQLQTFGY